MTLFDWMVVSFKVTQSGLGAKLAELEIHAQALKGVKQVVCNVCLYQEKVSTLVSGIWNILAPHLSHLVHICCHQTCQFISELGSFNK